MTDEELAASKAEIEAELIKREAVKAQAARDAAAAKRRGLFDLSSRQQDVVINWLQPTHELPGCTDEVPSNFGFDEAREAKCRRCYLIKCCGDRAWIGTVSLAVSG